MSQPFLNFRGKKVALVIAVHDVTEIIFFLTFEEIEHNLFLLKGFLSSCEFDAWIGAIFKGFEGFIEVVSLEGDGIIDCFMYDLPIDIFIIL